MHEPITPPGHLLAQIVRGYLGASCPGQYPGAACVQARHDEYLVADASAAQPEGHDDVAAHKRLADDWLPQPQTLRAWRESPIGRQSPDVRAECLI
jgi:hypothetical protein